MEEKIVGMFDFIQIFASVYSTLQLTRIGNSFGHVHDFPAYIWYSIQQDNSANRAILTES